jgi:ABC-type branched-subunit amino acid transport system substrate-binding protein
MLTVTRGILAVAAACTAVLAAATAARAGAERAQAEPGLTRTSIQLGTTAPLSGPYSSLAAVTVGANAYFRSVNARGGVNGRRIVLTVLDDAHDPAQTVRLTRRLVEQDEVFAVVGAVGTEQNLAVREYLNEREVPQLLAATGSTALGRDGARFPYTIGFQPSYEAEGWVYGKYLARTRPRTRIAVLFRNDDFGRDLLGGLERGLQRSNARVIAAEPYEPTAADVQAQVARLKATGADTFAVFAAGTLAIQAYAHANALGWRPKLVVGNVASSASSLMTRAGEGGKNKLVDLTVSGAFLKNPTDPQWRADAGTKLYRQVMKRFAPSANANDPSHVYGMAVAFTLVEALKKAGKDLTRERLVRAVGSLNLSRNPFLIPGIAVRTGPGDRFPVEQLLLQRWSKGSWKSFGGLWSYRG